MNTLFGNDNYLLRSLKRLRCLLDWRITPSGKIRGFKDNCVYDPLTAICWLDSGEYVEIGDSVQVKGLDSSSVQLLIAATENEEKDYAGEVIEMRSNLLSLLIL